MAILSYCQAPSNAGSTGGEIDSLEFDPAYGVYSDPIRISGNVWAVGYTADATFGPGRIKTISIKDYVIPRRTIDFFRGG